MEGAASKRGTVLQLTFDASALSRTHEKATIPKAFFRDADHPVDYKSRFPAFIILASLNEALRTIFLP